MSTPVIGRHPAYFGKLPSRDDFVRSSGDSRLLTPLDRWLSQVMELLAENPRWKPLYDACPPIDFAFLGARSRLSIAGHLAPSHDTSARRFPFISVIEVESDDPLGFLSNAPARLSTTWARLGSVASAACRADDAAPALQAFAGDPIALTPHEQGLSTIHEFLTSHSCGELEAQLSRTGRKIDLRRLIIALGLLLQPLSTTPGAAIARGLDLPLPESTALRDTVATLWLHLIGGFLRRTSAELQILLTSINGQMRLIVGFQGASALNLVDALAPGGAEPHNIRIDYPEWVDEQLGADYGLTKLSSYLSQPALSLDRAVSSFREVFLGE